MSEASPAIMRPVAQRVLVKRVRTPEAVLDGLPVGAPEEGGFEEDFNLRCLGFSLEMGPGVGRAEFDFVPTDGRLPSFEQVLNRYSTDDVVRVLVEPPDHETLAVDMPEPGSWLTVFEGVLERIPFEVSMAGMRDEETIKFVAVPTSALDNVMAEHRLRGRWIAATPAAPGAEPTEATPAVVEATDLPAVFNFRGRPNRSASDQMTVTLSEDRELPAWLFTHDEDSHGEYWTVAQALAAVVAMWGIGPASDLPRNFDVDEALRITMTTEGPSPGRRWAGMEARLPECNVHGLGVLDAIQAICDAAGMEMYIAPTYGRYEGPDRLYVLHVQRRGAGVLKSVQLQTREAAGATTDHAEALLANSVSRLQGMKDAARVRNEVLAVGRCYVEAAIELKPLWLPDDLIEDPEHGLHDDRYVAGGSRYADYRQVGRLWGIDCTGALAATGYPAGPYQHDEAGYDWVAELGLADGGSSLLAERLANGVTEPLAWTRRLRPLLPLKRPEAQLLGIDYVLEVSEDGGSSWARLDNVRVATQRGQCGVMLLDLDDLRRVSIQFLQAGIEPAIEDSWWQKILAEDLRVRVTCCVPADHAAVALAPRQPASASAYRRAMMVRSAAEEVWSVPGSVFNGNSLRRIGGFGLADADAELLSPLDQAERERDRLETVRLVASLYTWTMDFFRWSLGSRVELIAGRNFPLSIGRGDAERSPSLAAIYVTLASAGADAGNGQGVRLALADQGLVGGAY